MKRFIHALCFGVVISTTLAGCGGSGASSAYDGASEQEIAEFKAQYAKDQARQEAEANSMSSK